MSALSDLHFWLRRRLWPVASAQLGVGARGALVQTCLGRSAWFRSDPRWLEGSADVVLATWLLPLAWQGLTLELSSAVDPQLAMGVRGVAERMQRWWGIRPDWKTAVGAHLELTNAVGSAVALAFSCGVDSFYSLFFAEPRPKLLLGVGGFDLPRSRPDLLAARRQALEAVAAACGRESLWVETNLREHPLYRASPWGGLTHGAALVAVALMLRNHVGRLIISSGYHRSNLHPHGCHPDVDPLWSTSYLGVQHFDADVWRADKLVRLVDDPVAFPLVSRHLQVCWEHPSPGGNCGGCEKCVRLRLTLWTQRRGVRLETLPAESESALAKAVLRLGVLRSPALIAPYERFLGCGTSVERAVEVLLEASRRRFADRNRSL